MIRQSWSIRIEAPKPPPPPRPRSTASKVAHWAGIPHYRLPRFNLADEAMLQELQTDELDEEDYTLLPTNSSIAGKPRHEIQLVNVPDQNSFSDQAAKPKQSGGKLRKFRSPLKRKTKRTLYVNEDSELEEEPGIVAGDVQGHVNQSVPADFESNSADYPRHPRTPDRYMLTLSRGSSGRERRNSMTSSGDRVEVRSFNETVKAPVALRKSPPQFLQNWDDDNPYTYNYMNRAHDFDYPYPQRPRPSNRTMSLASSSSRLPILHESRHEVSTDEYSISTAHDMSLAVQQSSSATQFRQRRSREDTTYQSLTITSPHDSPQGRVASEPSTAPSQQIASHSDEVAMTEMSTEIQIGGLRTEKRPHLQPMRTIEEWVQKVGTPPEQSGTPKTIPSDQVEVDEERLAQKKTSPMSEEPENLEIPIPVPTEHREPSSNVTTAHHANTSIETQRRPRAPPSPDVEHIEVVSPKRLAMEETQAAATQSRREPTETETETPITVVRIPPVTAVQITLPPLGTPSPSPIPSVFQESSPRMPSPMEVLPPMPDIEPLTARPRAATLPLGLEEQHSQFSSSASAFILDPKAAEKRRMTVAFGITPLQRRETAELAQDVLRRVSTIGGDRRKGSLASVIRVVDVLLVKEREEQLKRMRMREMAWD